MTTGWTPGVLPIFFDRYAPAPFVIRFRNANLTAGTFSAAIKVARNAPDPALVPLAEAGPGAEGISVVLDGADTLATLTLLKATTKDMPSIGTRESDDRFEWDMSIVLSGNKKVWLAGPCTIRGGVQQ